MIRMRTQARELHRKYSKWRSTNAKTESKLSMSTSSPRKHSKVKKQPKGSNSAAAGGPPARITSTFAELQPSLPSAHFPVKPQQRKHVADSKISSPTKLLSPQKDADHAQRHSSTSIVLDKAHVIRSQSMSPSVRSNVIVMRAHVHSPHQQQSRALSPNTLKRVSWVPPDYAPPPKLSPLSRPSQVFDTADAQKRMQRVNRALSSSVLKQQPPQPKWKSLNSSRKSSVSPTRDSGGSISTKTKVSRNAHDIVCPDLPFSISGGNGAPNRPLTSVKLKSPTNAASTTSSRRAPRMTATFSHQPRKSVARKLRLESVSPTFHSGGGRKASRSNRSWLPRSVSAPRVSVTRRRKRSNAKSKARSHMRKRSNRPLPRRRSRSKSRADASGSRSAIQNFISISRAEINGDTLTLRPGTLLFYARLVFEFHAPFRSPQFHMLSEPEAAAWHVLKLWRDNLSRGVENVPRFAYIHAYRVTSDAEFAVRSAWEMAPDECDENVVMQDSVSRCTGWDKSIRSLDALKRYFRGQSIDFAQSRTQCHLNSHRSMLHHTPRPRPCCKLFFGESQRTNRCVKLELTRVYEVDIVEWLERMLEEPCALNRARILPLLRHPFKMRRGAAACSPLKETTQAADMITHMFRE